ncbi:MAG: hypothetical protein J7647_24790 [Cyanobacteria bacterium SBLK]|nr:hypothetical protein [Cyanobacteria bacterium SBLK]
MDDFLKGAIGVSVLIVVAGIVGAALNDSNRAFDLSPYIDFFRDLDREDTVAPDSTQNFPTSQNSPLNLASPKLNDNRLSICPQGSVEPMVSEVSIAKARTLRQAIANGLQFVDLIDLQATLGQPKCNFLKNDTRQYRYLVQEGKSIDALQKGDIPEVIVIFGNF